MKQGLVKITRKILPTPAVRLTEETYRRARVRSVARRYGNPAKKLKVLAVTGTNGKTTTAAYLNEILKAAGYTTAMFTTAVIELAGESKINDLNATVPTTQQIQQFFRSAKKAKVDYVVLEATSHALHQHKLAGVPIECAIFTNLTQDHLDYHKTMEHYAEAKAKLFKANPRYIVLNQDDEWFEYFDKFDANEHKITYGTNSEAECRISQVKLHKKGSDIGVVIDHQTKLKLTTALPGKFNVYNAVAATAAAYVLEIDLKAIVKGIAGLKSIPGRFEYVKSDKKPYEVIVDYAHTPDALKQLLEAVKHLTKNRLILVFGACGDRDKAKRPIMGEIAVENTDRIIVTDEESYDEDPKAIRKMVLTGIKQAGGDGKTEEVADRREAIKKALSIARAGDTVVITGMGHEQFRIVKGERLPWNDGEVVRELL